MKFKQFKMLREGYVASILFLLLSILSTPPFFFKFTLSSEQILSMSSQKGLTPFGIFT